MLEQWIKFIYTFDPGLIQIVMKSGINIPGIINILGLVLLFEGLFMLLPLGVSVIYHEPDQPALILSLSITILSGTLAWLLTRKSPHLDLGIKESFLVVSSAWFLISLAGTLPYILSGSVPRFVDAFFEAVSGFSTTGASILSDVENIPHGILFWRSLTNWMGGMGIVVLAVAILPYLNIEGAFLFSKEASTILQDKIQPRISSVAKRLYLIYVGFTVIQIGLLWAGDMNLFDAACHSFGSIATGGFSTRNASLAAFSPYSQYVVILFMIIGGTNFTLHYFMLHGRLKKLMQNEEFWAYLGIIITFTCLIAIVLAKHTGLGPEDAVRKSLFQVTSILTATGFANDDYIFWPGFCLLLIFILMFIGASSGSTGGGIKVVRHIFLIKKIRTYIRSLINPNAVFPFKINNRLVDDRTIHNVMTMIYLYLGTFILGTILITAMGVDIHTSAGATIATMGGIGPGIGLVGPMGNYGFLPDAAKYILSFLMIAGRLELFTVFVLFLPDFWRK